MKMQRRINNKWSSRNARRDRQGAAIVEFALLSPILVLLVLGTIDLGQYMNVSQAVSNASREGALVATRNSTSDVSEVDSSVRNYLVGVYPNAAAAMMGYDVQVTVGEGSGPLPPGGLGEVDAGSSVSVEVSVNYDSLRWLCGLGFLGNETLTSKTIMRKE